MPPLRRLLLLPPPLLLLLLLLLPLIILLAQVTMPDVMLGGGSSIFTEATVNNRTLLQLARDRGCNNISTSAQLARVLADPSAYATAPLLGLFSPQHMPYVIDKQDIPSLADMVKTALAVLKTKGKPFILFVEGSRIDHALHENDAAAAAQEVLAYDDAFAAAVAFADAQGAKGTGSASPTTVVRLVYFNATTTSSTATSTTTTKPPTRRRHFHLHLYHHPLHILLHFHLYHILLLLLLHHHHHLLLLLLLLYHHHQPAASISVADHSTGGITLGAQLPGETPPLPVTRCTSRDHDTHGQVMRTATRHTTGTPRG